MAVALSDRVARRVSASTRPARLLTLFTFATLIGAIAVAAIAVAFQSRFRVQVDATESGELTPSAALLDRLENLSAETSVTLFTTRQLPKPLRLLEWLSGMDPERRAIAEQEGRARLAALDDLKFWVERLANVSRGRLSVKWLDREQNAGAFHRSFTELGLERDRYVQRMASLFQASSERVARGPSITQSALRFSGLVQMMRTELSAAAVDRWREPEFVEEFGERILL